MENLDLALPKVEKLKSLSEFLTKNSPAAGKQGRLMERDTAQMKADLEQSFHAASTDGLQRLSEKLIAGRVIRGSYQDDNGGGCLYFFALGITSRHDLREYSFHDANIFVAVHRTMRAWDHGLLSIELVERVLKAELESRIWLSSPAANRIAHSSCDQALAVAV